MKAIVKRPQSCVPDCRPRFICSTVKVGDSKCSKLAIILIILKERELYSESLYFNYSILAIDCCNQCPVRGIDMDYLYYCIPLLQWFCILKNRRLKTVNLSELMVYQQLSKSNVVVCKPFFSRYYFFFIVRKDKPFKLNPCSA